MSLATWTAAAAMIAGLAGQAAAAPIDIFENGHSVQIRYYFPNIDTDIVLADTGVIVVAGGPELTAPDLAPENVFSVDLSTNRVVIGLTGAENFFHVAEFNGVEIVHFEPGIEIANVTLDAALSTDVLEAAVVGFTANSITVNFSGIIFDAGDHQLVLNISAFQQQQSTPIPEPASVALWSLLGLGAAGYYRRRQRRRAS